MARPRRYEIGLLLLLVQVVNLGADTIPPVTFSLVLIQAILYMNILHQPWSTLDVCISAETVWYHHDWKRLVLSAFEHGDDMHLYYNMVSLLLKGRTLEKMFGWLKFLIVTCFLTLLTSLYYTGLAYLAYHMSGDRRELAHCAIGFSAVLFAMKTILTRAEPDSYQQILNINVQGKYAPWVELLIIHALVPNSSFKGHLAGILVGLTYSDTIVGAAIDALVDWIESIVYGEEVEDTGSQVGGSRAK